MDDSNLQPPPPTDFLSLPVSLEPIRTLVLVVTLAFLLRFKELGFLSFVLLCFLSAKGQNEKDADRAQDNSSSLQDRSHSGRFRRLIGLLFLVIFGFFFLDGSSSTSSSTRPSTTVILLLLVWWRVIGRDGWRRIVIRSSTSSSTTSMDPFF
jgi:hypothetical protein